VQHNEGKVYSPECVEGEFSEVHRSKQLLYGPPSPHQQAAPHPFGIRARRLRSIRCTFVYQGVATRNSVTTREILTHRTGAMLNFALTEFYELRARSPRMASLAVP
jgi:hypothetical protein